MIHSRNKKQGFTLIETLFAIAILGSVLTPIILNQSRALSRIAVQSELFARTLAGLNFMINSFVEFEQDNNVRSAKKTMEDPQTTLQFNISDPRSSLKKSFKNLYKQEVALEWSQDGEKRQDNLVTFIFLPDMEE